MGSDDHYPEEAPDSSGRRQPIPDRSLSGHQRSSSPSSSRTPAYVTVAERPLDPADFPGAPVENLVPGSLVFQMTRGPVDLRHVSQWWTWTPGACWHHPEGPPIITRRARGPPGRARRIRGRRGLRAVGGQDACRPRPNGNWPPAAVSTASRSRGATIRSRPDAALANFWHGAFPWRADPGYGRTRPVGSYPPNGYGLFDMAGNVWEWTVDWYSARHPDAADHQCCAPVDPRGASEQESFDPGQPQFQIPRKVVKGGSFLCADSYCQPLPAGRAPPPDGRHRDEPHRLPLRQLRGRRGVTSDLSRKFDPGH